MKYIITTLLFLISVPDLFSFSGGNGTEADPYQISTKAHLELLADSVNNGSSWSKDKYFIVMNNITDSVRTIIGDYTYPYLFQGIFDGQGYSIALAINDNIFFSVALFGCVYNATIKNVIVNGYVI